MSIIELQNLTKVYSRLRGDPVVAVDDLTFAITEPGVHAFLGPNGSGKTTTIRCLLSLIRPTSGQARLLGADISQLHAVIDRIGALVETPKFFGPFSARSNLDLLAGVAGARPADIDRSLETVGLRERADDTFASYSLGMKQRLAVAATLLKNPDLIILDEPANGLDPQGIRDMRDLIRALGADGRAVFISSHQLSEIQAVCDTITILQRGRLIASGHVNELIARAGGGVGMTVRIPDAPAAASALNRAGIETQPGLESDVLIAVVAPSDAGRITQTLAEAGLYLTEMTSNVMPLEDAFLRLTTEGAVAPNHGTGYAPVVPPTTQQAPSQQQPSQQQPSEPALAGAAPPTDLAGGDAGVEMIDPSQASPWAKPPEAADDDIATNRDGPR